MIDTLLAKIFGTKNEREVKRIRPLVAAINSEEAAMQSLTDQQLADKTVAFKERIAQGASLDDLLVEAFAVAREAGRRVLNMRHFDVQLIGGIVLHEGKISEMRTGEGKTLVATLPVYLNALAGKGVHVITVNDYLAKRDSEWMGKLYRFLGLTVGCIVHGLDDYERQQAYHFDITYGTNNEFGFDYLRDNMKFRLEDCVQREHNFAIVDEVDSILIDEARTPLIISGPSEESTDKYARINGIIPHLERGTVIEGKEPGEKTFTGDYTVDEKHRTVALTEQGVSKVEKLLDVENLYDPGSIDINHHVQQCLKAYVLFHNDKDYVVKDDEVIIVDEFTGRLMPGRRWSDGLHQAVEAKEGVRIQRENQTLATITFQNYFRMYKKLAGMTGTADTEAAEFAKIYNLDVITIPTNRSMVRTDQVDIVYRTVDEKFRNAAKEIKRLHETGQPVLVGTVSVEKSELLSGVLKRMGVRHEVLNAKNHEREASIIAQAGRKGAVTVSTNMAGRGTDILLGGNPDFLTRERLTKQGIDPDNCPPEVWQETYDKIKAQIDVEHEEVVQSGGLHIVGTERHESRRIDNQLRGRAGRQGDPGASRFFLSLEDDLLRIFGGERMQNLMLRLGMEEDVPIESGLITKRIAAAQKAVEAQNFAARKHVLEYDDVMNKQRQAVYTMRRHLIEGQDQRERIVEIVRNIAGSYVDIRTPEGAMPDAYDLAGLHTDLLNQFGITFETREMAELNRTEIEEMIVGRLEKAYDAKEQLIGPEMMREAERILMLQVIDHQWKDHLLSMDHLKEGIGLRGYGQKDPLVEYKKESYHLFEDLLNRIEEETVKMLFFMQRAEDVPPYEIDLPDFYDGDGSSNGNGSNGNSALPMSAAEEEAEMAMAARAQQQAIAQAAVQDFTRSVQRKQEREMKALQFIGADSNPVEAPSAAAKRASAGRNEPCPCGSGKKYKKCCGQNS